MSSELQKEKWAVLSHRGLEATSLTHEEARRMVHRLAKEGCHGLCIVSDEAAGRLDSSKSTSNLEIPQSA